MARKRYWVLKVDGRLGYGYGGEKTCIHETRNCGGLWGLLIDAVEIAAATRQGRPQERERNE